MGPGESANAAARARFALLGELGCIVSRVYFGRAGTPGDIHHLVEGGKRLGYEATICLHPWFHRGTPPLVRHAGELRQLTVSEATARFGPSLALARRAFERRFGAERELLEMQDRVIEIWSQLRYGARGTA